MGKNFLWNTIGNILYLFSLWLITIIITIVVGYEENGVFTIAMSLANVFYVFSSYGLRGFQVSDIKKKYSDDIYVSNRFMTTIASLIVIFISALIMRYNWYTILIIMLFMVFKSFESVSDVFHGILQNDNKLNIAGISLSVKGISSAIGFTLILFLTKQMWIGLLFLVLIAFLIFVFFDLKMSGYKINLKVLLNKEILKGSFKLMKEALPMMLFMMTTPLLASIPKVILEKFYDATILGIYSSISTPSVIVSTLTTCVMTPLLPIWTKLFNNKDSKTLGKSFLFSCIITALIGVFGMIFSYFFGDFFLTLVFGESISPYSFYLTYVMLISTITALTMCCNSYMVIARKLYTLLAMSFFGCLLCLAMSLIFIKEKEILGVIIALIISETIQLFIMLLYIAINLFRLKKTSIVLNDMGK